jgi:hypothetical protein
MSGFKVSWGLLGYILGCMARIDVLGVLAPNQARSPNLAENFERYVIFSGLADNSDISDFSPKFRRIFFPDSKH